MQQGQFDYIDGYTGEAKDGFIDAEEINTMLTEWATEGWLTEEEAAIDKQLFGFQAGEDAKMSIFEFPSYLPLVESGPKTEEEEILWYFCKIDTNHDGLINESEGQNALDKLHQDKEIDDDQLIWFENQIAEILVDEDDSLEFADYESLIQSFKTQEESIGDEDAVEEIEEDGLIADDATQQMFDYLDGNIGDEKDGFVDAEEMDNFLTESVTMGGLDEEEAAIDKQLFGYQAGEDGKQSIEEFAEFLPLVESGPKTEQEETLQDFCKIDTNHDGYLKLNEVKKLLKNMGLSNENNDNVVKNTWKVLKLFAGSDKQLDFDE